MERQPATYDAAATAVATADHRTAGRIVADAVHHAGYLIPGRITPGYDLARLRRAFAAALVGDGLSLLHLAGGGPLDVVDAARDLDLYRRPDDDPRTVADRAADGAASRAAAGAADHDPASTPATDAAHARAADGVDGFRSTSGAVILTGPAADLAFPAVAPTRPDPFRDPAFLDAEYTDDD